MYKLVAEGTLFVMVENYVEGVKYYIYIIRFCNQTFNLHKIYI